MGEEEKAVARGFGPELEYPCHAYGVQNAGSSCERNETDTQHSGAPRSGLFAVLRTRFA